MNVGSLLQVPLDHPLPGTRRSREGVRAVATDNPWLRLISSFDSLLPWQEQRHAKRHKR
jgi:hypothetical protein